MTRRTILSRAEPAAERHATKWHGPRPKRGDTRDRALCRLDYTIGYRDGWRAARRGRK